jgi:Na+/H+ antiporter NhaC
VSDELISTKKYGAVAFLPMIVFLLLYVGTGCVLTAMGVAKPFSYMPRYVAVLAAIMLAILCYDRDLPVSKKVDVYAKGAGASGVMLLGIIVLMAGAFASAADAIGGKASMVNMGLALIPRSFIIPGIFIVTAFISTCIGTSMGTQVAMIPVAISIAKGAGLNVGMAGAATIAGAYFGDNLSIISDTTICATKGVGANMKDKFRMNFLIALPAALLTIFLYWYFGSSASATPIQVGDYSVIKTLPYITVLVTAIAGMDVVLVLFLGIAMTGVIGAVFSNIGFFDWCKALGAGMEGMFFLAVFAMLVSGLIELIRFYGGIDWLVDTLSARIKSRKTCEYFISLISLAIAGTTLNNTVAIIITAPIAKVLGQRYVIAPKRLASLLDIFSCAILMLVPHDSGFLLVQKFGDVTYLDVVQFAFYPILLMFFTCVTIQFGLLRTPEEKAAALQQEKQ